MRFYVSGPMRGHRKFNFPVFDDVTATLRAAGHDVDNPADHDRETQPGIEQWDGFEDGDESRCMLFDLATALKWDLSCVARDEAIVMLPGWEQSTGARIERFVAEQTGSLIYLALPSPTQMFQHGWAIVPDQVRSRMTTPTVVAA